MGIRRGRIELFHDDQLVVALPDLKIIARTLERFGVAPGPVDERPVLGLALIQGLANVDTAVSELLNGGAGGIGQELARYRDERAAALAAAPGAEVAGLDLLIRAIHLTFARDYPGWRVAIGKNYRPSPVKGYPHLGGGEGDPQPVDADLGTAVLAGCPDLTLGSGVRVGLLDTRMYPDPWLTGRYLARQGDLLDRNQDSFTVFDGHCAFVASCIVREAPAAEIHVRRVLDSQGDGTAWDAGVAMAETARTPVDVVNLSFGEFFTDDNTAPMIFEAAVKRFSPETVLVAAAGNNGDVEHLPPGLVPDGLKPNSASYPAALVDVVGVGALDRSGNLAAFTPHPAPWISLLAPGVGLTGAYVRGVVNIQHKDKTGRVLDSKQVTFPGTAVWEGCSFAAGVVSGAIAAGAVPGHRSAHQALEELLSRDPGQPGCGIRPNDPGRMPATAGAPDA